VGILLKTEVCFVRAYNEFFLTRSVYVVYIMTMIMNYGLKRMWKEAVVAYFKELPHRLPERTEEKLCKMWGFCFGR